MAIITPSAANTFIKTSWVYGLKKMNNDSWKAMFLAYKILNCFYRKMFAVKNVKIQMCALIKVNATSSYCETVTDIFN